MIKIYISVAAHLLLLINGPEISQALELVYL